MMNPPRRVIAATGPDGKSRVVHDGPAEVTHLGTMGIANLWCAPCAPVNNAAPLDAHLGAFRFEQLAEPVCAMMLAEYAPGLGRDDPGMHFTDTADHFHVIAGEVVLVLEDGEVTLRAGDTGVVRGAVHGWRNDSAEVARMVTFVLPAAPLHQGG